MREIHQFNIYKEYAHLLLKPGEGEDNGSKIVYYVDRENQKFEQIRSLTKQIRERDGKSLFLFSDIKREYSEEELGRATLLQLKIDSTFEPPGESCGTNYDESVACAVCGANRKQVGPLILKKGSIPKKDIARTISGEVIVSEKFAIAFAKWSLLGLQLESVFFGKELSPYFQIIPKFEIELSKDTIAGVDIFDLSEESRERVLTIGNQQVKLEKEIYKCPYGHTIGLNLLSEAYVMNSPIITNSDFFVSMQKIGVKRGLLRPEPLFFCSPRFRSMIKEEELTGFQFEVAHVQ